MSSTKLGMMHSMIEGEDDQTGTIEAIPKDKAETLVEIIRSGMKETRKSVPEKIFKPSETVDQNDDNRIKVQDTQNDDNRIKVQETASVADELEKLAKLKKEGVLTEQEFKRMKQDLIEKTTG